MAETETMILWVGEREQRIRKALSILGPTSPRFDRDDMKAALDQIDRLTAAIDVAAELAARYAYITAFLDGTEYEGLAAYEAQRNAAEGKANKYIDARRKVLDEIAAGAGQGAASSGGSSLRGPE